MKKQVLSFALAISAFAAHAQSVGIGTIRPDSSAQLDITAANKGVLMPRVTLQSATDARTIVKPATGLIVYNTNTGLAAGTGFFYNSGTPASPKWLRMAGVEGDAAPAIGQALTWNGTAYVPSTISISTTGTPFSGNGTSITPLTINTAAPVYNANKVQGKSVRNTAPTDGQVLVFNTTNDEYAPQTLAGDNWGTQTVQSNSTTMSGNGTAAAPLTVNNGAAIFNANKINSTAVSVTAPVTGQALVFDGTSYKPTTLSISTSGTAISGNGTATSPLTVNNTAAIWNANSINGKAVDFTIAPTNGQTLVYNSTTGKFVPGTAADNWGTQSAVVNTTTMSGNGTTAAPLTVNTGAPIFNANKINNTTISVTAPTTGQVLQYNGSSYVPVTLNMGGAGIDSTTASNGVKLVGNDVQLGGTLTGDVAIPLNGKNFTFTGTGKVGIGVTIPTNALHVNATNPVKLEGLQPVTATNNYKQLVVDVDGVLKTAATQTKILAAACDGTQNLSTTSFNNGTAAKLTFIPSDITVNTGGIYSFNDLTDEFTVAETGVYAIEGYSGYVSNDDASNGTANNNITDNWGQGINLTINKNGVIMDGTRYIYTADMAHTAVTYSQGVNFIATIYAKAVLNLTAGDKISLTLQKVLGNDARDPKIMVPTGLTESKKIIITKM